MSPVIYQLQLQSDIITAPIQNDVLIKYSLAIQQAPVPQITGFSLKLSQKVFWFANESGDDILLRHDSSESAFGNRLKLPNNEDFNLTSGSTAMFFQNAITNSWLLLIPPISGIEEWTAIDYDINSQVVYNGIIWIAISTADSSDIPGVSSKWLEVGNQLKAATYGEDDIDTTLTWNGTPPSGIITKKFVGNRTVTGITQVWFKIRATIAGANNTQLSFPLPTSLPDPNIWASQPSGEIVSFGGGGFTSGSVITYGGVYIKNVAGVYTVFLDQPYVAVSAEAADISVNYFS